MSDPQSSPCWYVYMVACRDESLYTGVCLDPEQRVEEHNTSPRGARYTRARRPVTLVYTEAVETRSEAMRREIAIKRLKREEKLTLIARWRG